ncbi:helix-turn-helix domain-containing protein [Gulbenkiania mobilis]|uniref:helix-turn-helix domain-containing protein n=1 Tax=Gulbenkiania mobilis TaxID=397457 RepID=UPI0006BC013F|nr:helix-turn-helix transcriptional regulator [Gulbenkiania mobilis]
MKNVIPFDSLSLRKSLRLTQAEFWEAIGVTQPGGSRYEQTGRVSPSVAMLIEIRHLGKTPFNTVPFNSQAHQDMLVGQVVRERQPEKYQQILHKARNRKAGATNENIN